MGRQDWNHVFKRSFWLHWGEWLCGGKSREGGMWASHLFAVWLWAHHWTSLSLNLLACKSGIIMVTYRTAMRIRWNRGRWMSDTEERESSTTLAPCYCLTLDKDAISKNILWCPPFLSSPSLSGPSVPPATLGMSRTRIECNFSFSRQITPWIRNTYGEREDPWPDRSRVLGICFPPLTPCQCSWSSALSRSLRTRIQSFLGGRSFPKEAPKLRGIFFLLLLYLSVSVSLSTTTFYLLYLFLFFY